MADTDVPPSPGPIRGPPSGPHVRFILQHFKPQDDYTSRNSPHNQDARLPADMSKFPPNIIVDTYYGCAALLQWGIPQAFDAIRLSVEGLYYDETGLEQSDLGEAGGGEVDVEGGRSPRDRRAKSWADRHMDQSDRRPSTINEAMDLILLLWSRSDPGHQETAQETQDENFRQDRVNSWVQN